MLVIEFPAALKSWLNELIIAPCKLGITAPPKNKTPQSRTENEYNPLTSLIGEVHKKASAANIRLKVILCFPVYPPANLSTIAPPTIVPKTGPVTQTITKTDKISSRLA